MGSADGSYQTATGLQTLDTCFWKPHLGLNQIQHDFRHRDHSDSRLEHGSRLENAMATSCTTNPGRLLSLALSTLLAAAMVVCSSWTLAAFVWCSSSTARCSTARLCRSTASRLAAWLVCSSNICCRPHSS